jgi:DNA-binding response OmpR family regulator
MRVLLVEDSRSLCESLRAGLRKLGHAVDVTNDGAAGLSYARTNPYDVIVLDLMLPGLDGVSLLRKLRGGGFDTRVLVLSARDTVEDRVSCIKQGADDYLVKPFAFDELVARLEAVTRRPNKTTDSVLRFGDLEIDATQRTVRFARRVIELTPREFALIHLLASRAGKVVTRFEIEDQLYDEQTFPTSNAVEAMVSRLRTHFAAVGANSHLRTRRGIGYVFDPEAT